MVERYGGSTPGMNHSTPDDYGPLKQILCLQDTAGKPKDNFDKVRKLGGSDDASRASAIIGIDADSLAAPVAEAAIRNFESDNWILRLHETPVSQVGGASGVRDGVWALRLVSDHTFKYGQLEHRSTIVVDNCRSQNKGQLSDVFWLISRNGACGYKTDSVGFTPEVTGRPGGTNDLHAIALNINKLAGFVTDGNAGAQLWHVFDISRPNQSGAIDCGIVQASQLNLRGDVHFKMEGEVRQFGIVDDSPFNEGDDYAGWLSYTDDLTGGGAFPATVRPPDNDMAEDPRSNHESYSRTDGKYIAVHVKVYIPNLCC